MPSSEKKQSSASSPKKSTVKKKSSHGRAASRRKSAPSFDMGSLFSSITEMIPETWIRPIKLALFDILMIGIGLVIFAYFHHVRPTAYGSEDVIVISRPTATPTVAPTLTPTDSPAPVEHTPQAAVTATPVPTPTPTIDPNDWGAKFADQFVTGYADITDTGYRSENISITIERVETVDSENSPQVYFIADIYIRDIESLRTAFAQNTYGQGYKDWAAELSHDNGGILAINGDYYSAREKGVVIRNGNLYRQKPFKDVCIIYYDGVMETLSAKQFNVEEAIARGAYQAFSFGPALLDENGKVKEEYDSEITRANPRCAIGYFEPGHYCFVVADGRQENYSEGLTMHELAQIFEDLGCIAAYNLDGGESASMVFMNQVVNKPSNGGRKVSDIVFIGEAAQ